MKCLLIVAISLPMLSCNTSIGLYRDTKLGVNWIGQKIQGNGGGYEDDSGTEYQYDAPVY